MALSKVNIGRIAEDGAISAAKMAGQCHESSHSKRKGSIVAPLRSSSKLNFERPHAQHTASAGRLVPLGGTASIIPHDPLRGSVEPRELDRGLVVARPSAACEQNCYAAVRTGVIESNNLRICEGAVATDSLHAPGSL